MVVGEAEIIITPVAAGFDEALKAETQGGFVSFQKDADAAGEDAGSELRGGVKRGASKLETDLTDVGVVAGGGLRKGVTSETSKLSEDLGKDGEVAGDRLSKGASGGLKDIAGVLSSTGLPLSNFSSGMDRAGKVSGELESHSSSLKGAISDIPSPLLAVGAAALAGAGYAIHLGEGMQKADAAIAGAAGTSVASADKIGNAFVGTAFKSAFSGQEMAAAFAPVAGQLKITQGHALGAAEALTFMTAAGNLAEGKQIAIGEATSATAGVLQAFNLKVSDSAHVTDVLYQASNATGQSVSAFGSEIARMRSKLGETSGSVGDLSGLIVDMAHQGITGRAAVGALSTGLNTVAKSANDVSKAVTEQKGAYDALDPKLKNLAKQYESGTVSSKDFKKETEGLSPAQEALLSNFTKSTAAVQTAQQKYKDMGVEAFNAQGKFVGMGSIIEQLNPKFKTMTKEQQLAAATTLFGTSAAKQMTSVINAGPEAYNKATDAVNKHNAAQKAADDQAHTLQGELQKLGKGFEDVGIKLGALLIPAVTKFAEVLVKVMVTTGQVVSFIKAHWELLSPVLLGPLAPLALLIAHFHQVEGVVSGVVAWIKNAWHTVETDTSHLVSSIAGFFSSLPGKVAGFFTSIAHEITSVWHEVVSTTEGVVGSVVHFFSTLPSKILSVLKSLPGEMLKLGEQIVEGLIHGIENAAGSLVGKVEDLAHKVEDPFKKVLGLFSPSKVMEKHGENVVEGLALGMTKNAPKAKAAAVSIAEEIVRYFESKVGAVGAAGIAGNAALESSYDPNDPGGGLFQTIEGRGVPQGSSVRAQLESAWAEIKARGEVGELRNAASPEAAARSFETSFERPEGFNAPGEGGGAHSLQRQAAARAAYEQYGGGAQGGGTAQIPATAPNAHTSAQSLAAEKAKLDKEVTQQKEALNRWIAEQQFAVRGGTAAQKAQVAEEIAIRRNQVNAEIANEKAKSSVQTSAQKAELQKQTSDQKTATSLLDKGLAAIHTGGIKNLEKLLFQAHLEGLGKIEKDLDHDHSSALANLSKELVSVYKEAQAKLSAELVKAHKEAEAKAQKEREKAQKELEESQKKEAEERETREGKEAETREGNEVDAIDKQAAITKDNAESQAKQIADATKVMLDQQAEKGLAGPELVAAQAQTSLDQITQRNDEAVSAAELAADQASGAGKIAEAQAAAALSNANATASVQEAEAQAKLDVANAQKEKTATSTSSSSNVAQTNAVVVNFYGTRITVAEAMSEFGWALKTGALPIAPPQAPATQGG